MELSLTISAIALLQQVPLWLLCPGRAGGDGSGRSQNTVARAQALLAGLKESGKNTEGPDCSLEGQVGFRLTEN